MLTLGLTTLFSLKSIYFQYIVGIQIVDKWRHIHPQKTQSDFAIERRICQLHFFCVCCVCVRVCARESVAMWVVLVDVVVTAVVQEVKMMGTRGVCIGEGGLGCGWFEVGF